MRTAAAGTGVGTSPGAARGEPPLICTAGLGVRFGDLDAVVDVDLDVHTGEVVAVIGPSGGGKSTFLRCLNLLQLPTAGRLQLDGEVIVDADAGRFPVGRRLTGLRREIGMVFQSFNLFPHLTALDNVVLAQVHVLKRTTEEARERGREILARVGLESKAESRPAHCSGGQQQRIAIARALALDPRLMLFDEPTSALDPELGVEVLAVMRELVSDGMTTVVVTHEMAFAAEVADRIVFMSDGRILESGPPERVLREPEHERTRRFLQAVLQR
ncbi:MAG TPA: amino acid ABC transporter ATP-binding protein [Gaiellaceae bacterium]|nr:amino acid ABC transporter ATP-binding protein [Gaiellaceae bacterium]